MALAQNLQFVRSLYNSPSYDTRAAQNRVAGPINPNLAVTRLPTTGSAPTTSASIPASQPPVNNPPANSSPQSNSINQQVEDFGSIIDRQYEDALNQLGVQETNLRGQASSAEASARSSAEPVRTSIANAQTTNLAGLNTQEQQAKTQSKGAIQQARDLFRQTQQQNIAQLSGLGLSSSSVNEALAEKLGVETARRIAGVTSSTDEVLNNINQERTRVNTFYKDKLTELETNLQTQIGGIQQQLSAGLNQINAARQTAASDKATRRQELMTNAQSQIAALQSQAQQFAQTLQLWESQKQASLQGAQGFVLKPTDFSGLSTNISNIEKITGAGYQPTVTYDKNGNVAYQLSPKKDKIENPFEP